MPQCLQRIAREQKLCSRNHLVCPCFRRSLNVARQDSSVGFKTPMGFMKSIGIPNQPPKQQMVP